VHSSEGAPPSTIERPEDSGENVSALAVLMPATSTQHFRRSLPWGRGHRAAFVADRTLSRGAQPATAARARRGWRDRRTLAARTSGFTG
jgi:hypothetical protein